MAMVMAEAGCDVHMWGRRPEICEAISIKQHNPEYLPEISLPSSITASTDAAQVLHDADIVTLAVPAQALRDNLTQWVDSISAEATLLSLSKGIEHVTLYRMSEMISEVAGVETERIAVLSGPNLAREIAEHQPTATVIACPDLRRAEAAAKACATSFFRPYTATDVVGVELGGAVKNVIALAVGIAEGLGLGHNTQASLITRGLAETGRLAAAFGADPATLAGLAGLGDLVATCSSTLSRNRTVGVRLGQGESLDDIIASTRQVAEGVKSCPAVLDLARKHNVDMPITAQVQLLLSGEADLQSVIESLLARPRKHEQH